MTKPRRPIGPLPHRWRESHNRLRASNPEHNTQVQEGEQLHEEGQIAL
ncbi:hypothetical protein [Laspinema olomoucense]